jgi:hypothetical protein
MCFLNLTNSFRNDGRHLTGRDFHLYIEEKLKNRLADNRFKFYNVMILAALSNYGLEQPGKAKTTAVLA